MVEKNLIINNRTLTYKGIFRVNELLNSINSTLKEQGYQNLEKKTEETVFPSGKKTFIELRPFKIKTSYVTLMIKIKIYLNNIIEITKEVDNIKMIFQQGDVTIIFDAWSVTDYSKRWGMKPLFFFLKAVINKFIYHFPLEEGFIGELKSDTTLVYDQIKALLNLYKYQVSETTQPTPEETKEESK